MAMPMPSPSAGDNELECMVGTWRGKEIIHPSPIAPTGGTVDGVAQNVRALDGFALVQDYTQSHGDHVTFRGHGVFRFDSASGIHHLHWFDSMGQGPTLWTGCMKSGRMTMEHIGPPMSMRAAWDFTRDGHLTYHMDIAFAGQPWTRFIDCEYRRDAD